MNFCCVHSKCNLCFVNLRKGQRKCKMAKLCSKSSCNKLIQANHHLIKCERCDKIYHKKCSGLSETQWKQFQSGEMLFNCPSCKLRRRSSVITPTSASTLSPTVISRTITDDRSLTEDDSNSVSIAGDEISKKVSLSSINNTIRDMEKSLSDLSDSITDIEVSIKKLECQMKEIGDLKEENVRLRNKITIIERRLSDMETNNGKKEVKQRTHVQITNKTSYKLTIGGIDVVTGENIKQLCGKVFGKLGLQIDVNKDITECCRLKPNNTTTIPVIVVELASKQHLDLILKASAQTEVNNMDFGRDNDRRVYINEKLSTSCYVLLKEAKKLRDFGYKFVWARNNRVLARKVEGSRVIQITDSSDIVNLMN